MTNGNDKINPGITTDLGKDRFTGICYSDTRSSGGLTKREYFAAMALQGILANSRFLRNHSDVDIHILSVKNADDLIEELNKPKNDQ